MREYLIKHGDCLEQLREEPENFYDAIVTDPPYGMSSEPDIEEVLRHWLAGDRYEHGGGGFMGKTWDSFVPGPEYWRECFRVLKPGGYLLAFASTRTYGLMEIAIRFARFEVRDMIEWMYGTGFPKSLNLGDGRGTALKPGHEPIVLARKPLEGTVAANVQKWGTGALNIDGCRIETTDNLNGGAYAKLSEKKSTDATSYATGVTGKEFVQPSGRWPANVILDENAAAELDAQSGTSPSNHRKNKGTGLGYHGASGERGEAGHSDSGGASRFFYVAKASRAERDRGCDHLPQRTAGEATDREDGSAGLNSPRAGAGRTGGAKNHHPTVKPIELMRYLVRMVTPPGGVVLDPFLGSGTTGVAALLEGFDFVGVEREEEYVRIAEARLKHAAGDKSLGVLGST